MIRPMEDEDIDFLADVEARKEQRHRFRFTVLCATIHMRGGAGRIADTFRVGPSVVKRWANGDAIPLPRTTEAVIERLRLMMLGF